MADFEESDNKTPEDEVDPHEADTLFHRLSSSGLNLRSSNRSRQRDPETLRAAFIHSAAIIFVFICGVGALLAYRILEPFFRSILWSIMAGAFLFPFKSHLTSVSRKYLRQLDEDSHLLCYGLVILLPLRTIDRMIESIFPFSKKKWKELLIILLFLLSIELIQTGVLYHWFVSIGYDIIDKFRLVVHLFDSLWISTILVGYLAAVFTIYNDSPWVKTILNVLAIPAWLILLICLSQILPINYRLAVIVLTIILTILGQMVDLQEESDSNSTQSSPSTDKERRKSIFANSIHMLNRFRTSYHVEHKQSSILVQDMSSALSTPYFSCLLWSFIAIKVYHLYWHFGIIFIFVIIYKAIKSILISTYICLIKQSNVQHLVHRTIEYFQTRRNVLAPSPLQGLVHVFIKGDKKLNHGLQASIDYLVSACMIVTLLLSVLFGTILLIIQIQYESIHMIKLTSNLINETLALQPSFQHMLPDKEHVSQLMDTAVNNFYSVGRNWIVQQVNALSRESSSNAKLEKDVLQLWDQLYAYMSNASLLFLPDKINLNTTIYSQKNYSFTIPNLDFRLKDLYGLINNNLDFLRSVLDSLWTNTTLLLTLLSTILSLLFSGGFALFNFLFSFIVFVTLLFYLLSHSNEPVYLPTEYLNSALAVGGRGLGKAVNDAVTSVFVASLKIAAFYGLYTYVLHTLIGSNLVFLPAFIASICAVTLKSYWAALPGCLDVWLVQQRPFGALLLLLGQIAPVYVVDTAIYSEVKGGGHQYLTALAIAGGVYYRGIEGALIGPIVLCCLLVGAKLYNETVTTTLSPNHLQKSSTSPLTLKRSSVSCFHSIDSTMANKSN